MGIARCSPVWSIVEEMFARLVLLHKRFFSLCFAQAASGQTMAWCDRDRTCIPSPV